MTVHSNAPWPQPTRLHIATQSGNEMNAHVCISFHQTLEQSAQNFATRNHNDDDDGGNSVSAGTWRPTRPNLPYTYAVRVRDVIRDVTNFCSSLCCLKSTWWREDERTRTEISNLKLQQMQNILKHPTKATVDRHWVTLLQKLFY